MKLQVSTLIALYAVLELASDSSRQLSVGEIAERYGISTHHLAKVMRRLVREGLVHSVRGAGGGYRFRGRANRTTLFDIISLFEDLSSELDIVDGGPSESTEIGAALYAVRREIDELTQATLQSITLKTLLKSTATRT